MNGIVINEYQYGDINIIEFFVLVNKYPSETDAAKALTDAIEKEKHKLGVDKCNVFVDEHTQFRKLVIYGVDWSGH